ncbi:MAG TPA: PQQ-dependent sugar dehydrogenase [Polyangiaceae bacterium]
MRRSHYVVLAVGLGALFAVVAWLGPGTVGRAFRSPRAAWDRVAFAEERPGRVDFEPVGLGFSQATDIQFVPGAGLRAVVLQKTGTARVVTFPGFGAPATERRPAQAKDAPLLFEVEVRDSSELGLLGLAFSPKFRENGLFYVNYNPKSGEMRTRIAEWFVPPSRIGAEPAKERRVILEVTQPYSNHDGGCLAFGPDGMLYIGLGDGGAAGDPQGNGQNLGSLLGKMLRIDVARKDAGREYAVPPDNPFVGKGGARPEVWAYGLRNPWRYSFDPKGRLIAGDVGQDLWEEISLVERGKNLGWKAREGFHCFSPKEGCRTAGLVEPLFEYDRSLGISVTGGYVVTGKRVPALVGRYVFGDFGTGRLWALDLPDAPKRVSATYLGRFAYAFSTFGRDADGELYAADFGPGGIYRLVAR